VIISIHSQETDKAKRYGQINNLKVGPIYIFDKAAQEIEGTKEP